MRDKSESETEEQHLGESIKDLDRMRKRTSILFNVVSDWWIYANNDSRLPFDDWMISIKFLLRDNLPSKTLTFPVGIARRLIVSLESELKTLEKRWEELPDTLKNFHKKLTEKSREQPSQAEQRKIEGDLRYYQ